MLEHAIYGVSSPEGAAAILWRDQGRAHDAATAMKITAQDLLRLGIIDAIVSEATGGAHRDRDAAIRAVGDAVAASLTLFDGLSPNQIRDRRAEKFLEIGRKL